MKHGLQILGRTCQPEAPLPSRGPGSGSGEGGGSPSLHPLLACFLLLKHTSVGSPCVFSQSTRCFHPNCMFSTRLISNYTSSRKPSSLTLLLAVHLCRTLCIVPVLGSSLKDQWLNKRLWNPSFALKGCVRLGRLLPSLRLSFLLGKVGMTLLR